MTRRGTFSLVDGVVVDTSDPQQMGRVKVLCPAIDNPDYTIDNLPWASYVTPFAGQTRNFPAGSSAKATQGLTSYGFWAIPKVGAHVIVGLLFGDPNRRYYLGSFFPDHGNRSLPTGRNRSDITNVPVSDTFDPIQPQTDNLNVQFSGNLNAPQARTRGAYERQVAQDKNVKDGTEGYQKGVLESGLDPQTYCLTTPGRHVILFQDNPTNSRVRIKSAEGHQVIFDDANERIYISTSHGNTWLEMDKDGHVHLYGAASISMSAGEDINLTANGSVNISAGKNFNVSAAGHARVSACSDLSLSGSTVNITSTGQFNILASGKILQTGSAIHLNGPDAPVAPCATAPSIVPNHEPWERPATKGKRGSNWRP